MYSTTNCAKPHCTQQPFTYQRPLTQQVTIYNSPMIHISPTAGPAPSAEKRTLRRQMRRVSRYFLVVEQMPDVGGLRSSFPQPRDPPLTLLRTEFQWRKDRPGPMRAAEKSCISASSGKILLVTLLAPTLGIRIHPTCQNFIRNQTADHDDIEKVLAEISFRLNYLCIFNYLYIFNYFYSSYQVIPNITYP
jgi:hypothetical protein